MREAKIKGISDEVTSLLQSGGIKPSKPERPKLEPISIKTRWEMARLIDHTLLKPQATRGDIERLCQEARKFSFASVCVNPCFIPQCVDSLQDSGIRVCSVAGFPLGANLPEVKALETKRAVDQGAQEVDMVMNLGALKSNDLIHLARDMEAVLQAAGPKTLVKVIIEAALLSDEEKVKACAVAQWVGADFVKTSTGFGPHGATVSDVALMRKTVGWGMGVKAAGGIRDFQAALQMVEAGASRIGTSSGVRIVGGE